MPLHSTFVKQGEYELQESSTGEKKFYRFKKPKQTDFPVMLELFARVPDALGERPGADRHRRQDFGNGLQDRGVRQRGDLQSDDGGGDGRHDHA